MNKEILEIIKRNNGLFNWYSLDRALSVKGMRVDGLMKIIKYFEHEGFIKCEDVPNFPAMPKYWLTDKGRTFLDDKGQMV